MTIEWMLAVYLCAADNLCGWMSVRAYDSEERCIAAGLAVEPNVARFRCRMQQQKDQSRRLGPDQRRGPSHEPGDDD